MTPMDDAARFLSRDNLVGLEFCVECAHHRSWHVERRDVAPDPMLFSVKVQAYCGFEEICFPELVRRRREGAREARDRLANVFRGGVFES